MPNPCPSCAGELPIDSHASRCGSCLSKRPLVQRTFAPFMYANPIDQLVVRYKSGSDLAAGQLLASLFAKHTKPDRPEALVPVPMHIARLRKRGFDQSLCLAKDLSKHFGVSTLDALLRQRDTPTQAGLKRLERRKNMRGAFAVRQGLALPQHVALVDDVATTGSTLDACALVLRKAGVVRVDAWVIAKAN